jgi:hypothetical protein
MAFLDPRSSSDTGRPSMPQIAPCVNYHVDFDRSGGVISMLRVCLTALAVLLTTADGGCAGAPPEAPPAPVVSAGEVAALAPLGDGQRQNIAAFRSGFFERDKSYSEAARAEAAVRLAKLEQQIGTLSQAAFDLELARIAALSDNGHTHYNIGLILQTANRAPIRLAVFGTDFYVVRAAAPHHDLLGAKLTGIDGREIAEVRKAAHTLWGGTHAWRDRIAFVLLESPELLNAAGLTPSSESAVYTFTTARGEVKRALAGDAPSAERPFAGAAQTLSPTPLSLETSAWRTALDPAKAPWSLQDWGKTFRWRDAPEIDGIVLDMRSTNNNADMKIADALKMFEAAIAAEKPTNLVLDLRLNSGGNLLTTRQFARTLPDKIPGKIFVLSGPGTFSAAISTLGYLKQAAPARVFITGEPVGDRMMFWAESPPYALPVGNSTISMATERHDYADGCRAYDDCHRLVKAMPIALPTLAPDIAAPWTIEAYLAGRDPAMEAVVNALR